MQTWIFVLTMWTKALLAMSGRTDVSWTRHFQETEGSTGNYVAVKKSWSSWDFVKYMDDHSFSTLGFEAPELLKYSGGKNGKKNQFSRMRLLHSGEVRRNSCSKIWRLLE